MFSRKLEDKIHSIPLKEMDAAVLTYAILDIASENMLNRDRINYAIKLAAYLHRNDYRRNRGPLPKTHYIEHPLRNTLRLMRWGVLDEDIIVASILHDTVEDHGLTIVREFTNHTVDFEDDSKHTVEEDVTVMKLALEYVKNVFGARVAYIVDGVSNRPFVPGLTKNEKRAAYAQHVIESIAQDVAIFWVKLSDFVDNAIGLYHNNISENSGMIAHLALKYAPLVPVFQEIVQRTDMLESTRVEILVQLESGKKRLEELSNAR